MTRRRTIPLAVAALAVTAACAGNPEPAAPASAEPVAVTPEPVTASPAAPELTDEQAMELARSYVEMLHARDFAGLWARVTPESQAQFGSLERFQEAGAGVLDNLGAELGIESETVEPARAGMAASKLYHRVSLYAGSDQRPVRLTIGMVPDGSIAGIQLRPAE